MTDKTEKPAEGAKSDKTSDKTVTPSPTEVGKRDRRVTGLRRR